MNLPENIENHELLWDHHLCCLVTMDPFSAHLLALLNKQPNHHIDTMRVAVHEDKAKAQLEYSPDFLINIQKAGGSICARYPIIHELYHIALGHCDHRKCLDKKLNNMHNIACDLAINDILTDNNVRKMPPVPYKGIRPADYKYPSGLSMEGYLELLKKEKKEFKEHTWDDHGGWTENPTFREEVRSTILNNKDNPEFWGSMSAMQKDIILAAQKPKILWLNQLRQYIEDAISPFRMSTRHRPNRRNGYCFPGSKKMYTQRVRVSLDTSASMSNDILSIAAGEINGLLSYVPIDLVMHDAAITYGPEPYEQSKMHIEAIGRGGTSFVEVFEQAEKDKVSTLILFTDGQGTPPNESPRYISDVIWVIMGSKYFMPPVPWGKVVRIPNVGRYL